jgi:hypothetical protein
VVARPEGSSRAMAATARHATPVFVWRPSFGGEKRCGKVFCASPMYWGRPKPVGFRPLPEDGDPTSRRRDRPDAYSDVSWFQKSCGLLRIFGRMHQRAICFTSSGQLTPVGISPPSLLTGWRDSNDGGGVGLLRRSAQSDV